MIRSAITIESVDYNQRSTIIYLHIICTTTPCGMGRVHGASRYHQLGGPASPRFLRCCPLLQYFKQCWEGDTAIAMSVCLARISYGCDAPDIFTSATHSVAFPTSPLPTCLSYPIHPWPHIPGSPSPLAQTHGSARTEFQAYRACCRNRQRKGVSPLRPCSSMKRSSH